MCRNYTLVCKDTQGRFCKFPFKYDGTTYRSCTTAGGYNPWCAYTLNSDGSSDDWEYCGNNCGKGEEFSKRKNSNINVIFIEERIFNEQ